MKRILIFLLFCSVTAVAAVSNKNQLYQVFNDKKPNGDYNMMVKEIKRTDDTSELLYKKGENAPHIPPVISSVFIMCACYDVAKERGFKNFANLGETTDGNMLVGFSNQANAEIIKHFEKYNNKLKENDIVSVNQFGIICDAPTPYVTKEHYTPS